MRLTGPERLMWLRAPAGVRRYVGYLQNDRPIFENPAGYQTRWQHFFIPGPYSGAAQAGSNAPNPSHADDGLVITGNVIANGDGSMPLATGGDQGCAETNPTCNEAQLYADNDINAR